MKILDTCRQIIDTESGRILLYRDEVEAVLTAGDCISRRQAIDALGEEPEVWTGKDEYAQGLNNQWHYDVNALKTMPSAQPEPQWIPCSERVPEKSGQYYVSGGDKVWICEFLIIPNFTGGWCNDVANPVVQAWMPLPEPYKAERREE